LDIPLNSRDGIGKEISTINKMQNTHAQMMELVDMLDSKSGVRKDVGVQVPLWVKIGMKFSKQGGFFLFVLLYKIKIDF